MATKSKNPSGTVQINAYLEEALAAELRDAAFWIPGENVSSLVSEAVRRLMKTLAKRFPEGKIPTRPKGKKLPRGPVPG